MATLTGPMTNTFESLRSFPWLASAYLVASAAAQPMTGRLTDIYGRREGVVACNLVFAIGTLLCGVATREWVLILGRVLAGLGGGSLNAVSTFLASDLVPTRKRGILMGIVNVAMGVGAALGGPFGGWISSTLHWRWAFLVQVPFLILAAILTWILVRLPQDEARSKTAHHVDWQGALVLLIALSLFLVGLTAGGNIVPWFHPLVGGTIGPGLVLLAFFVLIELRIAHDPIIPLAMLAKWKINAACWTYLFTHMALYGLIFFVPIYVQILGLSPAQAGLRLIPYSIGAGLGSLVIGFVIRATGHYMPFNFVAHAFMLAAAWPMVTLLDEDTQPWLTIVLVALFGIGFGCHLVVNLIALISSADHKFQALLTSTTFAFRSIGAVFGISACSLAFQNALRVKLLQRLGDTDEAIRIAESVRAALKAIDDLDPATRSLVTKCMMEALHLAFGTIAVCSTAAALIACTMGENKLNTTMKQQNAERDS